MRPFGRDDRHPLAAEASNRPGVVAVLTAEDVVEGKPHPEIYLKAAERFQLKPSEVVVFEDSQNGCRAATAAGTIAIAVPGGHSLRHDFSGATMVVDQPMTWSPENSRSVSFSAKAMWFAVWPGVVMPSSAQPSPLTTSPSASA